MSVFCISCGQEQPAGTAFCDNCGAGLAPGCPSCGSENRPGARFCRGCGTPLSATSPAVGVQTPSQASDIGSPEAAEGGAAVAERRLVTVLFADLVAFTDYSEGRDPEIVRETLSRYFEGAREVIEHHGGVVEKFIGDAVMAAWGAARANEDDAERAVRAALEVVSAVKALDEGLEARVAVLTGQAAVTLGAQGQGMVAGDLVNTAARLQAVAPPGGVLVGEATMQAASSAIVFEEAGAQVLKGKDAPVPAWRVLRVVSERGGRSRSESLEPPFVGREIELRLLKDLLHVVGRERRPRLVSITGPAGIGKSRLAWEFEKYLDGLVESVYWHRGRAPSYGEGVTFWALGEMVRNRADLAESDDEATTRARIAEMVAEWVPDAADREWVEPALLTLLGLEPPPPGGREVLFAAWRILFERIAARGLTVMLFEDLQWADGGQLDFIDHLMEWAKGVPLLVITLARPDLLERRPGWGTSARSFNTIGLEPLTDAQVRELLLGLAPDLPEAMVSAILARADGIPLYAVETVRMLIADGRLVEGEGGTFRPAGDLGQLSIPDTLRALIASRLDGLDPDDRALLQVAAVLGKTFPPDALAAICDSGPEGIDTRLRSLMKKEILEVSVDPRSPERGQYGFVQSVIREVAYDTLSRRDRRSRHLAAARYFEGLGEEELAGVLSSHYLAAYEASDPGPEADELETQARVALRGAADRAIALGAFDQAQAWLEQALGITTAAVERAALLERAAEAADLEGSYERATELGYAAIAAHEEAGDREGVARASVLMGGILADGSRLNDTVSFLEGAIARADRPGDEEQRAGMLARLSRAHMRLGNSAEAVARADEALAIAEPRRLTPIIAEAFINKAAALSYAGRLREPVILLRAAVELAAEVGDLAMELRARNNLAAVQGNEDGDAAMSTAREAYELSNRLGVRQMSQWIIGAIGYGAIFEGLDWEAAIRGLDDEIDVTRSDADRARLLAIRESVLAWRGESDGASDAELRRLNEAHAWDDPDAQAWTLMRPAIRGLVAGDYAAAIEGFGRAIEVGSQNASDGRFGLVLASHLARDGGAARKAMEQALAEPASGHYIDGIQSLARAGVAAFDGRGEESLAAFQSSVDAFGRSGARFHVALVQLDALTLLPSEPSIAAWADDARERFEVVKSPPLLERLDEAVAGRVA